MIELAQIEGGGDGVLVSLASLSRRYAKMHGLVAVEWIVHAVSCAKPNLKLRRVLEGRGFIVKQIEGVGEAYPSHRYSLGRPDASWNSGKPQDVSKPRRDVMAAFFLWCILFVLCWPIAILALIAYPFVWLLLLPFRIIGIAVHGVLALVWALVMLPVRLLSAPFRLA